MTSISTTEIDNTHHLKVPSTRILVSVYAFPDEVQVILPARVEQAFTTHEARELADMLKEAADQADATVYIEDGDDLSMILRDEIKPGDKVIHPEPLER